jgi:hypothetical protein
MAGMIVSFVVRDFASQRLMHQVRFLADCPYKPAMRNPLALSSDRGSSSSPTEQKSPDQEAGLKSLMSCC